jgi:hypothetical protein
VTTLTQTVTPIHRFPRLPESALQGLRPESTQDKLQAERAALEDCAFQLIARRRELRMELGKTFIRIKATLKHGGWESYFAETFTPCGISLRTAQRYMDLVHASEAAADSKDDKLSPFKPARDPQAVKVRDATEKAQEKVGDAARHMSKREQVYKLILHLSVDERDAADQLWKSPHRARAEEKIIDLLKQLCIEYRKSMRRNTE